MNYKSTRDQSVNVTAAQAIAQGISKEGGLFVPEKLPSYSYADLCALSHMDYVDRAQRILSDFLTDFTQEEIQESVTAAYAPDKFGEHPAPLALQQTGEDNMYLLELWHGPTCAFKDMALQLLPHLLTKSLHKTCDGKTAVILVATSGDTGKAALEGFKDVAGTKMLVFYPEDGVSPMQKRQMATQEGANVHVCAIEGNFDDAQTGVKKIFTDPAVAEILAKNNMLFSSANSINWGRLLPQIVYYFSAYCDLMSTGEIDHEGEEINIVVPTGNFGNILAAYYARSMGLPVQKLICASNSNNVLTDFIRSGTYDKNRHFYTTISPSMDILVSSNLERLLYHMTGGDTQKVSGWMAQLAHEGRYTVDETVLRQIQSLFYGGYCNDEDTERTIKMMFDTEHYLCDTHTAVAINVYKQYVEQSGDRATPTVIASTASPYKFAASVLQALEGGRPNGDEFAMVESLSALTGTAIPAPILALKEKGVRFNRVCDTASMLEVVFDTLGIR